MSETIIGSPDGGWSEKSWLQAANPESASRATLMPADPARCAEPPTRHDVDCMFPS